MESPQIELEVKEKIDEPIEEKVKIYEPIEEKVEKIKENQAEDKQIDLQDPPQAEEKLIEKVDAKPNRRFSKFKKNEENKDDAPVIEKPKSEILTKKAPFKSPKAKVNPELIQENHPESDKPVELNEEFQEKLEKVEENCKVIQKEIENLEVNLKPSSPKPLSSSPDPEASLKQIENRLQEAESDKNKVQVLLDQVKTSLEGIQSLETYSEANRKPNFECKNQSVHVYEQLKQKSELTSERLKKFREDQKTRESLLAKELKRINKKIEKEKKLLENEHVKIQEFKNEEYQKELEKMKQRKLKRKQELEEIKKRNQDMETLKNSKPLYKKIEEDYEKNLKKSEKKLQKEKELNRKSPINVVDLMEHAKWYEGVKREHREKQREKGQEKVRSSSYGLASAWTTKVLEEDQKMKKDLNRASQERLNMIERKTKYAELVKEMFMPTVDRIKRQENQSRSPRGERLPGISKKSPMRGENFGFGSDGELKYKGSKLKWKDNPMVPKPLPKKQGHVVDYLEEKRKEKQEEGDIVDVEWEKDLEKEYTTAQLAKVLRKKAKILESKARKHELLMSGNPTSAKTLKNNENVNDMLLSSIKAKLAALEQRANN